MAGGIRDPHNGPTPSCEARVWCLNACLGSLAVVLFLFHVGQLTRLPSSFEIPWWVLASLFYLAEALVVHFHFRRDAHSFSLSEVPLVLGLFFTSPPGLLLAQAVGTGAALAIHRKQSALKVSFNVGHLMLEAGLAVIIFRTVIGLGDLLGPAGWLAAFLATTVTAGLGVVLIMAAISLANASLQFQKFSQVLALGVAGSITNTSLALVGITILTTDRVAIWLLLVPAAALFAAYRAYMSERQKHESIEFLYESSRMLRRWTEVEPALVALLSHARKMFRAEISEIVLFPSPDEERALRTRLGPGNHTEIMEPVDLDPTELELSRRASEGQGVLLTTSSRNPQIHAYLASKEATHAIVASLRGESRIMGLMMVANRVGAGVGTFGQEDLRLFGTVADQASVSLENGRLEQSLTQLRKLEEELKHQAFHDSLTRLANRALFADRVQHALAGRAGERQVAVLFLDLDDFKTVNDSMGHAAGDQLLIAVAERLESCLDPQDTAARLGGDEFAVLLEDVRRESDAELVAERIVKALRPSVLVQGVEVRVHASIGIVLGLAGEDNAEDLLRNADVAMYTAKREGKGRHQLFHPRMQAAVVGRHELKADIQRALDKSEFTLHYQPIVELGSGRIVALEALLRWIKPRRGIVHPEQFIPLAEETGLILPLGAWALEEACARTLEWQRKYEDHSELAISVNISVRQLQSPAFMDDVVQVLHQTGLDPHHLILEITESAVMEEPQAMVARLKQLKELGLRVAIDDFGTGYSSLSWLRHLPIDVLKIARPFVEGIGETPEQGAFASAIAQLGGSLRMTMVAEGIEKARQVAHLRALHLTLGQGNYFARPMNQHLVDRLLAGSLGARRGQASIL